jgi:hypothetical protein
MALIKIIEHPKEEFYKDSGGKGNKLNIKFIINTKNVENKLFKVMISLVDNDGDLQKSHFFNNNFNIWHNNNKYKDKTCYSLNLKSNVSHNINFKYDLCSRNNKNSPYKLKLIINNNCFVSNKFRILSKRKINNNSFKQRKRKKIKKSINNLMDEPNDFELFGNNSVKILFNSINMLNNLMNEQNDLLQIQNELLKKISEKDNEKNILSITNNNPVFGNGFNTFHKLPEENDLSSYPLF